MRIQIKAWLVGHTVNYNFNFLDYDQFRKILSLLRPIRV